MLYFMGYTDTHDNWTGNFTKAMRNEFKKRNIEYTEIPPYDWYNRKAPLNYYSSIESKDEDVWLIGWAQSPLIEHIQHKKGKKYGIVVGLTATPFEPAVLWEADKNIRERKRLSLYDKIFVSSDWCRQCIYSSYPELINKVIVTGFPIEYNIYDEYLKIPKDENLIVFNQRFALEKMHILELEIAKKLTRKGYRVQHLSGQSVEQLSRQSITIKSLLNLFDKVGLEYIYNNSKDIYHKNLAKASTVVTTSIADMLPNSMLEAIYLGLVPIAPRNLCFPEFIHNDNLYTPYDIDEIVDKIIQKPIRHHPIAKYEKEKVIYLYLKEMQLL